MTRIESFRKNVLKLLKGRKWNRKVLARESGVHYTYVNGIISGDRRFHEDHLLAFAKALGVTPDYLIKENPEEPNAFPERLEEIIELYQNVPEIRDGLHSEMNILKKTFKEEVAAYKAAVKTESSETPA